MVSDRFDLPTGFKIYANVEQLLFKVYSGDDFMDKFSSFCDFH